MAVRGKNRLSANWVKGRVGERPERHCGGCLACATSRLGRITDSVVPDPWRRTDMLGGIECHSKVGENQTGLKKG